MSTSSPDSAIRLQADLNNYLAQNDKPALSTKLKQSLTNVKVSNWWSKSEYSRVPTEEQSARNGWFTSTPPASEGWCPTLTRMQRIFAFGLCITLGITFFTFAAFYLPFLLLKARKFSLLFTLGSLFMVFSFSFLWGPVNHLKHLFSRERFFFTTTYFGSLILTLYFAMFVQSTPFTVVFAVLQIVALVWFLVSYIPGGQSGLWFMTRIGSSAVSSSMSTVLPV